MFEGNDLPGVMLCSGASGSPPSTGSCPGGPRSSRRPPTAASKARWRFARRGRGRGGRRRARGRGRRGARGAAGDGEDPATARHGGGTRVRTAPGQGNRGGRARRVRPLERRYRTRHRLRSGRRLGEHGPGDLAAAPSRGQGPLGSGRAAPTCRTRPPPGSSPRARSPVTDRRTSPRPRARSPAPRRLSRSGSGTSRTGADSKPSGMRSQRGRARRREGPGGGVGRGAWEREVLRLPLRGRHHRRHRLLDRRGLRLAGAAEALHDGDHGAVPGTDVPARLDPPDVGAHPDPGGGGRPDHREAAVVDGADGSAGRPAVRAGEALGGARAPSGARRQRPLGGRLAAARTTTATPRERRWPCTRAPG